MFDLDGTLADTLTPIAAAANHMLAELGLKRRAVDEYRYLAGQGLEALIRNTLPEGERHRMDEGRPIYQAHYARHGMSLTRPYPGVTEMLGELSRRGIVMAVLSNKPHEAVVECLEGLFPGVQFSAVMGITPGSPIKPDPAGALGIARELGIEPGRWMYVGDTAADMRTGRGAGMFTVGVTWGFREESELRENGAQAIVHEARGIVGLVDRSGRVHQ